MTANFAIVPDLLERAPRVGDERTQDAVPTQALQGIIARREHRRVAELLATLEWDESFDCKAERSRRG